MFLLKLLRETKLGMINKGNRVIKQHYVEYVRVE